MGAKLGFIIGGAQKCGTSAIARYLSAHPQVQLPGAKEAHVFDLPSFDDEWTTEDIDRRFDRHYAGEALPGVIRGDATPITLFHARLVARVARYNQRMKWIILLRDPVERAISHYFMERGRGKESRSLAVAIAAERFRLLRHMDDLSPESPLRIASYATRGRYCRQLDILFRHFPREQVLLLRSQDLNKEPRGTVAAALTFLGLEPNLPLHAYPPVFEGRYSSPPMWSPGRWLLRVLLAGEKKSLRRRSGVDLDRLGRALPDSGCSRLDIG